MNMLYLCDRKACVDHCSPECLHTKDIRHAKNFELMGDGATFIEKNRTLVILKCDALKPEVLDKIRERVITELKDGVLMVPTGMKALTVNTDDGKMLTFEVRLVEEEKGEQLSWF